MKHNLRTHRGKIEIMTPLSQIEKEALSNGERALKFSIHKYNSYITDREITLAEATKCVVYQSKWAASHDIVDSVSKQKLEIAVEVISETEIPVGLFVIAKIVKDDDEYQEHFIVTQSKSHWFFLLYGLANTAKTVELKQ